MPRGEKDVKALERIRLLVPLEEARAQINTQLERGSNIPNESINKNDEAKRWYNFTSRLLQQLFTSDEMCDEFTGVSSFNFDTDITTGNYLKKLRSIYEQLELIPLALQSGTERGDSVPSNLANTRRVFVVHGHDDGAKETVARYLTKLELNPVVLHEQPNKGRTVIEKFEEHANVSFAVVLLTPDDIGYPADKVNEAKPRARQNVVLELGFFMAKLGRERVCVLYKKGVEIPSDYSGILYHQMDEAGAWRLRLASEIKAAGVNVDLNNAV